MLLYNLSIWFYTLAIKLVSPFNTKAKAFLKGRKTTFENLTSYRQKEKREILWFHAASLGEFEQGLPVMERFRLDYPDAAITVSFFSPSGYERRKYHPIADFTCYLPIDNHKNARQFIQILNPKAAFFIKYEYWFHFLSEARNAKVPVYSLSARFTKGHMFFKPRAKFQRSILKLVSHFFVQTAESQNLLKSIEINSSTLSGDTRFDRVKQTVSQPESFETIAEFKGNKKLLIVGSAWASDLDVIAGFINSTQNLKVIIAPHEVDEKHVQFITKHLSKPFDLYTEKSEYNSDILILNTVGMLSHIYQYGDFAYIGGAFGAGLHNILEAVAFGLPVVFGNKGLDKFPESTELADKNGAWIVSNAIKANEALADLMDDNFRQEASQVCLNYIEEKAGATESIMSYFKSNGL